MRQQYVIVAYKMSEKKGSKVTSKIIVIRVIFCSFSVFKTLALLNLYALYARHKSLMALFCVETWFDIYIYFVRVVKTLMK